jgi:hypothetical protein
MSYLSVNGPDPESCVCGGTDAVLGPWSSGQTEGQIYRLKTLKWTMYGRAGVDLLRARLIPLQDQILHRDLLILRAA